MAKISARTSLMTGSVLLGLVTLFLGTRGRPAPLKGEQIIIEYPGRNPGEQGLLFIPASGEHTTVLDGTRRTSQNEMAVVRHISGSPVLPYLIADADIIQDRRIVLRKMLLMDRAGNLGGDVRNLSKDVPMRSASISPDGTLLAYIYMLPPQVPRPILCLLDLRTNMSERLEQPQAGTWTRHPLWSPDGKNLVYERVTLEGNRAKTAVWKYSLEQHTSRLVMPTSSNAAAAVFISDTELAVFCDRGLVRVNERGDVGTTILPYKDFEGLQYLGAGVGYIVKSQTIATAFQDPSGGTVLFRVRADGSSYTRLKLKVSNVTFIGTV